MKKFFQKLVDSSIYGPLEVIEVLSLSLLSVAASIWFIVTIIAETATL